MKCRLVIGGLAGIDIYEEGWSSAGVIPAIELALERVNNHSDILKDYHLDIEWKDSRVCNSNEVPWIMMRIMCILMRVFRHACQKYFKILSQT